MGILIRKEDKLRESVGRALDKNRDSFNEYRDFLLDAIDAGNSTNPINKEVVSLSRPEFYMRADSEFYPEAFFLYDVFETNKENTRILIRKYKEALLKGKGKKKK